MSRDLPSRSRIDCVTNRTLKVNNSVTQHPQVVCTARAASPIAVVGGLSLFFFFYNIASQRKREGERKLTEPRTIDDIRFNFGLK